MKKTLLLFMAMAAFLNAAAQSHLQWSTSEVTPGSQTNIFKGMKTDAGGNTYVINFTQSAANFWITYRFFAYNNAGVKLWQYDNDSCFSNCNDMYSEIVPVNNNGAVFIGTYDDVSSQRQLRIKRIDANGNLVWHTYINNSNLAIFENIKADLNNNGQLVIVYSSNGFSSGSGNFNVTQMDLATGNILWQLPIPGNSMQYAPYVDDLQINSGNDIFISGSGTDSSGSPAKYCVAVSNSGSLIYNIPLVNFSIVTSGNPGTAGTMLLDNNSNIYRLVRLDSNYIVEKREQTTGNFLWSSAVVHDTADFACIGMTTDGDNFYVLGNYRYFFADSTFGGGHWSNIHYSISKLNSSGSLLWQKDILSDLDSLAQQTGMGGATQILFCGNSLYALSAGFVDSVDYKLILHKMDTSANTIWYDTSILQDFLGSGEMDADSACSIYVARSIKSSPSSNVENITEKYTDDVTSVTGTVKENEWLQINPNPVAETLKLKVLGGKAFLVSVFNCMGQKVMDAQNQHSINVSALASGLYVIKVTIGEKTMVAKFLKE